MAGPLVVLLGWLGSQPKYLRRYEELHSNFDVLVRIASPSMIIDALLRPLKGDTGTTVSLAREIDEYIRRTQPSFVIFHIFSNGGGLVFESFFKTTRSKTKVAGVILDSCPSVDLCDVSSAFEYCTPQDQLNALQPYGACDISFLNRPETQLQLRERSDSYLKFWTAAVRCNDLNFLFLYSLDDSLARVSTIDMLVCQAEHCLVKKWETSSHVMHLLRHYGEYRQSVDAFVKLCYGAKTSRL